MSLTNWSIAPNNSNKPQTGEYIELAESGQEDFTPENARAIRVFLVLWSERLDFINDLLGFATPGNGGGISRTLPEAYPNLPLLFATDARSVGKGKPLQDNNSFIAWDVAQITTTYTYLDYEVLADGSVTKEIDRFVTRTYSFNAQYLSVQNPFKFCSGQKQALKQPPGMIIPNTEATYCWHQVPANISQSDASLKYKVPTADTIQGLEGKVNAVAFDGYAPGTVLFMGVDPHRSRPTVADGSNSIFWELTYKFGVRDNGPGITVSGTQDTENKGWNYFYNPDPAVKNYDLVTTDGTLNGQRLYGNQDDYGNQADFNDLFVI